MEANEAPTPEVTNAPTEAGETADAPTASSLFSQVFNQDAPAEERTEADIAAEMADGAEPKNEAPADDPPAAPGEAAENAESADPIGGEAESEAPEDASVEDIDTAKDAPEEEPVRGAPPWRVKMSERKERQANRIEEQWQQQLNQQQQLYEAKLEAMAAQVEAIKSRDAKPANALELPDDPSQAFEVVAKKLGMTATEYYTRMTERMANGGEPGSMEALEYARRVEADSAKRHEELQKKIEEREAAIAAKEKAVQVSQWVSEGTSAVMETLNTYKPADPEYPTSDDAWWLEYAPDSLVQSKVSTLVKWAAENHPGKYTADDIAAEVDKDLSAIYARFKPDADPTSSPRVKDTRREAPEKPAKAGSRKSRTVTSKDAAATSAPTTMSEEQREALAAKLFDRAVGAS